MSIENGDPPNFEGLFPLYDSYGKKMVVEFVLQNTPEQIPSGYLTTGYESGALLRSSAYGKMGGFSKLRSLRIMTVKMLFPRSVGDLDYKSKAQLRRFENSGGGDA